MHFWAPYDGHPDCCQSLYESGPLEIAQVGADIAGDGDFTFVCYLPWCRVPHQTNCLETSSMGDQ